MTSTLIKTAAVQPLNAPTLHRLPNGLTIVAEQMPVEAVNLDVWLDVGSAVEDDAINGMAHFLEHMIFKGTAQLQSGEFERRIEQRGAITNAATSQDYTHYYITTAPQDFAELAPLQLDVLMNAQIPDDGFERERHVVLEEIRRSQDNPRRRTFQHATELTFDRLPYRRQVLGPTTVIEHLTAQQMRDFHRRWYQPQAMTAVAVGNLPVDELIRIVEDSLNQASQHQQSAVRINSKPSSAAAHKAFSAKRYANSIQEARSGSESASATQNSPDPRPSTPDPPYPEPPFQAIVRREFTDDSLQQARLVMIWRVPGLNDFQQTYVFDVLASILSHGRATRLVQDLREQRGLVSSISASNMTYRHQGAFYISAQLPAENLEIVEAAIVHHLRTLQADLISEAEIARIRTRVANHFIFGSETPSDRAGLYGYYQSLVGDLSTALNYPSHIQALDAEAVRTAAQTYLSPEAYGVVIIKP